MMRSKLLMLALTGSLLLPHGAALAMDDKCDFKNKEMKMEEFLKQVNATPEQRRQLQAIHQKYETQMDPLEKTMWQQKQDLMTYVMSPGATQAEANRRMEQMQQTKSQLGQLELQAGFEKKAVLTPEQQQKAISFLREKGEKMEQKMDKKK